MKRILTLALAALLVVAFAIPAFAAPKIELVGGAVKLMAGYGDANWGAFVGPVFGSLKFKLSADNFVFDVTTAYNKPAISTGEEWNLALPIAITNYNMSLELPYMTLSSFYDDYTASFGYHGGHELRLASSDKFQELAGFNWAVYNNDDNLMFGSFDSFHAQIGVPVGEAFNGTLEYVREGSTQLGRLDLTYSVTDDLSFEAIAAKNITAEFDDFFFGGIVNFPIVEFWTGSFTGLYGMANFAADTDWAVGYGYGGDLAEATIEVNYANEAAHAQFIVDYTDDTDFSATLGAITGHLEYVSNGNPSFWSSNQRRALYGGEPDSRNRGWNTQYKWVRNNSGNAFAVRVNPWYNLDTNDWDVTAYGMFAPDVIPVVITAEGYYASDNSWYFRNWLGIRITPDIHLAVYDRYDPTDKFQIDAAIVYNKDNVTASLTGVDLESATWGLNLFCGIDF